MTERGMARRQYQQDYYQSRKEELQKRNREYYWEHREQLLAKYRENREKHQEYKRKYYLANREKLCKAARERYYKLQEERMEKGDASCCRWKRMHKEELMPRCPYCNDEMQYVVLNMVRRTARLHCPTCDSEFPSREEESDDDD